ncbi:MAG TPA: DUF2950 family protein [Terriglobales bacterium]|nr:DUF2950 family protein [Terriglobales bacterium]
MRTNNMKLETLETFIVRLACGFASSFVLVLLLGLLLVVGFEGSSFAQEPPSKTFSSPGEASNALFQAAQNADEQTLEAILGAGKEVTSSNDEVEDQLEREQFTKKYQEMHRLVREPDGSTVLYIGAENWPFPIPLVSENGNWHFDSKTGTEEILFRRIGENETTAIEVCEEFALTKTEGDAKATNAKAVSQDPITRFAQSLITPNTANAGSNTGATGDKEPHLFYGYYFRRVSGTSVDASGKKKGLALVAYPADYRSSGVKTFVVTQKGIVFEKDLGPGTPTVAPTISARGSGWRPAESGPQNGVRSQ